jgi:hypothetical protein
MRAERDITHAERSVFAGLGMIGMAGLSAFQGANVPEYRPMAYIFSGLWLGLVGVNFRMASKIAASYPDQLPFQDVPVLNIEPMPDTQVLARQIGLEG